MSQHEYLRSINTEIQKLNGIIDRKILADSDYRKEARRHKQLLAQLRKEEARRSFFRIFMPSWR